MVSCLLLRRRNIEREEVSWRWWLLLDRGLVYIFCLFCFGMIIILSEQLTNRNGLGYLSFHSLIVGFITFVIVIFALVGILMLNGSLAALEALKTIHIRNC